MIRDFDDARLEQPGLLEHQGLRWLASAGARLRRLALQEPLGSLARTERPRGLLVMGQEARLIRAVLEPVCPVPLMAWSGSVLPAWVGPLDLVAVVADDDPSSGLLDAGAEARRRGATLLVAARERSEFAQMTASPDTTLVPVQEPDPTAAAIALLALLGQLGLGPHVDLEVVADAMDLVAEACAPTQDLSSNPGKELALQLADCLPLIWGGTVLANRAGRRLAEAVRRVSGVPALAADASELLAILRSCSPKDPFADPDDGDPLQPVVVLLDADKSSAHGARELDAIVRTADVVGVRTAVLTSGSPDIVRSDVERYATLLARGLYGAEYLGIGLTG